MMIGMNVKILLQYVHVNHQTNEDQWFFFMYEIFGKRNFECCLYTDITLYPKLKCFLKKVLSNDVTGNQLKFYFNALVQAIMAIPKIEEQFFKSEDLNECGRFINISRILNYPLLEDETKIQPIQAITKPFTLKQPFEINYEKLDNQKLVFEFYRYKCFRVPLLANYSLFNIEVYRIIGEPGEEIFAHIYYTDDKKIEKLHFLTGKIMDREISQYVIAHFKSAFVEKRYPYVISYKVT